MSTAVPTPIDGTFAATAHERQKLGVQRLFEAENERLRQRSHVHPETA